MALIRLDHVSVNFPIYDTSHRLLRTQILAVSTGGRIGTDARQRISIQALTDVSLSVEHGDRLALVGHNGAGKTTLLRVMAGIYEPTIGSVDINGRAVPIFDLGVGMDPESSGYENIVFRGLYLGLSRTEIRAKTEEIAAFTELGSFLNMPLRTYSAGMHARLAFAISTCIEPEILLLDETIAAGDAAFQQKARRRIEDVIARTGILVFASHAEDLIRNICNKAVLLEHGRVIAIGSVDDVFARYKAGF
jgi:ABC-2 type transport system ATP-binding protein/lipopolysaccharide transport system ATP-binding protein